MEWTRLPVFYLCRMEQRMHTQSADGWCEFFNIEDTEVNGIEAVSTDAKSKEVSGYYTFDGKQIDTSAKGVNVVCANPTEQRRKYM